MTSNRSKTILFWFITLVFPFICLVLVEIGLRVGGYNENKQMVFVNAPNDDRFLVANTEYVARYFPKFVPKIAPNAIRKQKQPNTFRIIVFGGSSAQGFPYNFYHSFSEQLEQKLLLNTDGLNVEVINMGMTAVNSYVIWDLSNRMLAYQPDAVIIYAGHNEYYGSFGAATTQFGLVNNIGLKRFILRLKYLRIYQLLEYLLKPKEKDDGDRRTMMARVVKESNIEINSAVYEHGLHQFERNISDAVEVFREEDIPVFLSTIASNIKDQAPLGDNVEAISKFEDATSLFENGHSNQAAALFYEAKELDGIRFRAPAQINEIIKEIAEKQKAILVDTEGMLRTASESGLEDASLFLDHLHPNFKGHRLISELLFNQLLEIEELEKAYSPNIFNVPDEISRFEDVYSRVSIDRLLVGYPFKKGLTQAQELEAFNAIYTHFLQSSFVDSTAAISARTLLVIPEQLTTVVNYEQQHNDTSAALTHYYELMKWQLNSLPLIEKGIEYAKDSRRNDEFLVNMILQVLNDGAFDPRYMNVLSSVYLLNGEFPKAKYWLDKSEQNGSKAPMLFYNLAKYHIMNRDTVQSNVYYNKFLQATRTN